KAASQEVGRLMLRFREIELQQSQDYEGQSFPQRRRIIGKDVGQIDAILPHRLRWGFLLSCRRQIAQIDFDVNKRFDSIESVISDLQRGKMVIVVDDADRENEGDLIMAAECVTAEAINFMAMYGRGLICVPTTSDRLKQLGIEQMVVQN